MCGGLRVVLEVGYTETTYTAVEINSFSHAIGWWVIGSSQEEFPGQLLDKAIRGCYKRLPQDICPVGEDEIRKLMLARGPIHFICAGWQCQSMSIASRHLGQEDDRFLPLYDLIKIINYVQANQYPKPLYLLGNT